MLFKAFNTTALNEDTSILINIGQSYHIHTSDGFAITGSIGYGESTHIIESEGLANTANIGYGNSVHNIMESTGYGWITQEIIGDSYHIPMTSDGVGIIALPNIGYGESNHYSMVSTGLGSKSNFGSSNHYPMITQAVGTSINISYGNSYNKQVCTGNTIIFRFGLAVSAHKLISTGKGWINYTGNGSTIHILPISGGAANTCNFGQASSVHYSMKTTGIAHNASINIGNSIHPYIKNTGKSLSNISLSNLTFSRCSLGSVPPTIDSDAITSLHYDRCS